MRINRQLALVYRGLYDWHEGERHILRGDTTLCGAAVPDAQLTHGSLYQHECCARCWQRWRREEEGFDVRRWWM